MPRISVVIPVFSGEQDIGGIIQRVGSREGWLRNVHPVFFRIALLHDSTKHASEVFSLPEFLSEQLTHVLASVSWVKHRPMV